MIFIGSRAAPKFPTRREEYGTAFKNFGLVLGPLSSSLYALYLSTAHMFGQHIVVLTFTQLKKSKKSSHVRHLIRFTQDLTTPGHKARLLICGLEALENHRVKSLIVLCFKLQDLW
ncbi:hypothetical protein Tcan_00593, partial [Toxocara canis]